MNDLSPTNNQPAARELSASVQVLTLPPGIYAFTVQGGASNRVSNGELVLPALQVGLAPTKLSGTVEFLASGATLDRWLASSADMVTVRISGESASLLLTSLRSPSSSVLAIEVQRLDANLVSGEPSQAGQAAAVASDTLTAQILAHIKNVGDLHFGNGRAGYIGHLWIEAFAVKSVGRLGPNLIEYRGVTADGFQTPWLSNQMLCGSRGRGMPMTAYAVRLKPEISEQYDCAYTGRFASGRHLGPFTNGDLCSSDVPGDPLEAIELRVTERNMSEAKVIEIQHSNAS